MRRAAAAWAQEKPQALCCTQAAGALHHAADLISLYHGQGEAVHLVGLFPSLLGGGPHSWSILSMWLPA